MFFMIMKMNTISFNMTPRFMLFDTIQAINHRLFAKLAA